MDDHVTVWLGRVARRAGRQEGFGLIELLAAMIILLVGILALFTMFQSGAQTIRHASTVATASALADKEMESFRAVAYDQVALNQTAFTSVDSIYTSNGAYGMAGSAEGNSVVSAAATFSPTQTLTGADAKSYRVDDYVTWHTDTTTDTSGNVFTGRPVKVVTVVVRDSVTNRIWAGATSTFDQLTGT
jgi:prepilin-type N-terminal cleavage/methylation domain-containing protein